MTHSRFVFFTFWCRSPVPGAYISPQQGGGKGACWRTVTIPCKYYTRHIMHHHPSVCMLRLTNRHNIIITYVSWVVQQAGCITTVRPVVVLVHHTTHCQCWLAATAPAPQHQTCQLWTFRDARFFVGRVMVRPGAPPSDVLVMDFS